MATCPYCLEEIKDNARICRHCHSYIDKDAQPKRASEAADLVIKFVGFALIILTSFGAITAGALAIFGFKSFEDVNSQIKQLRIQTAALTEVSQATLINTDYERYERILDYLVLDEDSVRIAELKQMHDRVRKAAMAQPVRKDPSLNAKVDEMNKIIQSIEDYKAREYESAFSNASAVNAPVAAKYRMLVSINSQLFKKYKNEPNDFAKKYLIAIRDNAEKYYNLKLGNAHAYSMLAIAYKREASYAAPDIAKTKYNDAIRLLREAAQLDETRRDINYNSAACYARLHEFDSALRELKTAQVKGDLKKRPDIDFFLQDEDFLELRNSQQQQLKEQLGIEIERNI